MSERPKSLAVTIRLTGIPGVVEALAAASTLLRESAELLAAPDRDAFWTAQRDAYLAAAPSVQQTAEKLHAIVAAHETANPAWVQVLQNAVDAAAKNIRPPD